MKIIVIPFGQWQIIIRFILHLGKMQLHRDTFHVKDVDLSNDTVFLITIVFSTAVLL